MSKFNQKKKESYEETLTYEGAKAYVKNSAEAWMNFLFSSNMENRFYESAEDQTSRYIELTNQMGEQYGWGFVAKAAHFARNEIGMRSISELTAAILNGHQFDNKRKFFAKYFRRPDGVSEVFAAIDMLGEKRSHALIRGASDYISSLGEYQITKYKMNGKQYNMFDLINLTHAKSATIDAYKRGQINSADTWETRISASKGEEEKASNWRDMVENNKLGYLALIRNLRNIVQSNVSSDWIDTFLVPSLINEDAIRKSLVFPYQIYCAWKNVGIRNYSIDSALSEAFKISCGNISEGLKQGTTCVVLDVSGSMSDRFSANSSLSLKEVGAVYGAALILATGADFIKFGDTAKKYKINPLENVFSIIEKMQENDMCGYGTNIMNVFYGMNSEYDRLFIISDLQTMTENNCWWIHTKETPEEAFHNYCHRVNCHPNVYSFDLSNYRSTIFKPTDKKIHGLTTLDDTVFKMIPFIENGQSLVDYINKNYSYC